MLQLYFFRVEGNGRPWNVKEGKAKGWQESNVGRAKIALSKEKVNVLSVLSTYKCLVILLPEGSLIFLLVEYCKVFSISQQNKQSYVHMYYALERSCQVTQLQSPLCRGANLTPRSLSSTSRPVSNSSWFQLTCISLVREPVGACWQCPIAATVCGDTPVPHISQEVWMCDCAPRWEISFSCTWHCNPEWHCQGGTGNKFS